MELLLLGTGASDGIPAFYADSPVSRYAREHGGKDVRTRAAAILDGTVQIDLGPDIYSQCVRERIDPADWSALVFTHSHEDHCAVSELQYALIPFTDREFLHFPIFANGLIRNMICDRYPQWPLEVVETRSFVPFVHEGYRVTPIAANHKEDEDSQNLIFEKGGKTLLYGTDTGVWHEPTWEFLSDFRLDALVIECTDGFHPCAYHGHLSIKSCLQVVERLRTMGTVRSDTQIVTTHHSHLGGATHAQLEEALAPHGIQPGYDGLRIHV